MVHKIEDMPAGVKPLVAVNVSLRALGRARAERSPPDAINRSECSVG